MFSSNPAISAMEDPVYDIWVVSCVNETPILDEEDVSDDFEKYSEIETAKISDTEIIEDWFFIIFQLDNGDNLC